MKNGEITNDGGKLRAVVLSLSSFKFVRFSKRVDIVTSIEVQVRKLREEFREIVLSAPFIGEQK